MTRHLASVVLAAVFGLAPHGVANAHHPLLVGAPAVATGYSPFSLVAADVNNDGLLDLVASNHGEESVSVALGAGDGSFSSSRRFPAPAGWDIATADLDRDGAADLAVTSDYGHVALIRGLGDGSFGPPAYYQVSPISRGVQIGDFNGDAVPDVAVGSAIGPGVVSVLLGKGDGTLWPRVDYPAGSGCNGVLTADLNADGALDLVVGNDFIDEVSVLLGNGDGTFREPLFEPVVHPPWGIACGDFDGDGVVDLAAACEQVSGQVALLSGRGDGTFDAAVYYPVGNAPFDLKAADFDQDGAVDLVVSNRRDGDISVLLGNGDGTLDAAYDYGAGREPRGLVCADFDGDGRTDVAIADLVSNCILVKLNVHPFPQPQYESQWVPPLHDGTTREAPDGPFKRGRTIPVKFRLLDAEGQLVPDEVAEGFVAELVVFYEQPCDGGIPTDPGDAVPDTGSEFRYVAEDDLFIFNLSTKDPAWIADYTYGLEVLIDGARVGEVFFSLR